MAFSPDGRLLATATGLWAAWKPVSHPPEVRLWDTLTGREVARLAGAAADASSLCFSPDGRRLVSGHQDGTLLVWDVPNARPTPAELTADETNRLWADLAGADAGKARRAVGRLVASGARGVALVRRHLRPVAPVEAAWVRKRVAGLDSDSFEERQRAFAELAERVELVRDALKEVLAGSPSPEVRKQLRRLLEEAEGRALDPGDRLRELRALEVLERVGTPEARALLLEVAGGAPPARLTREAKAALDRLPR
jgi:hypothetical protein